MDADLLRFEHVACSYAVGRDGDAAPVCEDVSFRIGDGDFVGIVGPSGSGKTTVLRAALGLVEPVFGTVWRRDETRIGYVPQLETVDWDFPITVREVVEMCLPRPRFRRPPASSVRRVEEVLSRLGLADLGRRQIRALSGGQQQRVFIARALVADPDLLVLDEPAGGVDVATRHELLHLLADLHHDGTTILLTTHDINGLAAHLPRLICFNRTVIADGPASEVLHPYVLERTYGAAMDVLRHGGMPVVLEHRGHPHVAGHDQHRHPNRSA